MGLVATDLPQPTTTPELTPASNDVKLTTEAAALLTPQPSDADLPPSMQQDLAYYREQFQRSGLSAKNRHDLEVGLVGLADKIRSVRLSGAQAQPKPLHNDPPTPDSRPSPTPIRGIFQGFNPPLMHGGGALTKYAWQDDVEGKLTRIYAGALDDDLAQGIVMVEIFDDRNMPSHHLETIYTPTKIGAVTLTAVQNLRFSLQANDGTTLIFDLPSRMFIGASGQSIAPAPTATQLSDCTNIC